MRRRQMLSAAATLGITRSRRISVLPMWHLDPEITIWDVEHGTRLPERDEEWKPPEFERRT